MMAAIAFVGCRRVEDHAGQPMSYWIASLTSPDTLLRRRAAEAFAHDVPGSPEAVDALLRALATEQEADVHVTLADALAGLGPDAVAAVPALIRLLSDEHVEVRVRTVSALGTIGVRSTAAVPAITGALADADHDVRANAALALERIGPPAVTATGALVKVVQGDRIGWVRLRAVVALGAIRGDPGLVVPVLAQQLDADWTEMRRQALMTLAAYGTKAGAAAPAIRARLADSVSDVRVAARQAMRASVAR